MKKERTRNKNRFTHAQAILLSKAMETHKAKFEAERPRVVDAAAFLTKALGFTVTPAQVRQIGQAIGVTWTPATAAEGAPRKRRGRKDQFARQQIGFLASIVEAMILQNPGVFALEQAVLEELHVLANYRQTTPTDPLAAVGAGA